MNCLSRIVNRDLTRDLFRLPTAAGSAKGDINEAPLANEIVGFKADNNTLVWLHSALKEIRIKYLAYLMTHLLCKTKAQNKVPENVFFFSGYVSDQVFVQDRNEFFLNDFATK